MSARPRDSGQELVVGLDRNGSCFPRGPRRSETLAFFDRLAMQPVVGLADHPARAKIEPKPGRQRLEDFASCGFRTARINKQSRDHVLGRLVSFLPFSLGNVASDALKFDDLTVRSE